jgi:hypothetical protein
MEVKPLGNTTLVRFGFSCITPIPIEVTLLGNTMLVKEFKYAKAKSPIVVMLFPRVKLVIEEAS